MRVQIIGEIGINHNASVDTALKLIARAHDAGCDYVKFQKREPRLSVPRHMWDVPKETPWGLMTYLQYKEWMEFGQKSFSEIDAFCKAIGTPWFLSAWDIPSAEFAMTWNPPIIKIPSAKVTDTALMQWVAAHHGNARVMLSTGMCTWEDVDRAMLIMANENPIVMACTSTYPCPPEELNLRTIQTYKQRYPGYEIGWSGHEVGLVPSAVAVGLGATWVERHITLDRASWGTDQSSSVEDVERLVHYIRLAEASLGDGEKRIMPGEIDPMKKLRGVSHATQG